MYTLSKEILLKPNIFEDSYIGGVKKTEYIDTSESQIFNAIRILNADEADTFLALYQNQMGNNLTQGQDSCLLCL